MVPEWVLYADISANAVRLYAVLRRFADGDGQAWPTRRLLADRMRLKDRRRVDSALDELVGIGALAMFPRWRSASGEIVEGWDKHHPIRTSSGYEVRG